MRVINVCVAGALGKVGRLVAQACLDRPTEFALTGAVARQFVGEDLGEVLGREACGVSITDDIESALLKQPDVLIDYTHPQYVRGHVDAAIALGIASVIGATGLTEADFLAIDAAARLANIGVISANFSTTAALLQHLAKIAARHISDFEIIEYGPITKPDVPSGTARELARHLAECRTSAPTRPPSLIGDVAARGAEISGSHVHSIRLPGGANTVEVTYGLPGETLTLRAQDSDPIVFVVGTLYAAKKVGELRGLVLGLDGLLFG